MGPLFSFGLVAVFCAILFLIILAPSAFFLPLRKAFIFAAVEVPAICIGGFIGLVIQFPFVGETLDTPAQVYMYFAVALSVAGLSATVVAVLFRKLTNSAPD